MCVVYRKRRKGVECCSSSETFRSFFSCFLVKKQAEKKNQVKKADREKQKGGVKKKSILIKKVSRITTTRVFLVSVLCDGFILLLRTLVVLFSRVASIIYCVFIVVSKSIVTSSSISKRFSRY